MILISNKEHEERRLELFKMLLPEMIPEKLKYYKVDNLVGHDLLANTLKSNSPGTGLLDILKGRVSKAKEAGCEVFNQVDGKITFTELGVIPENLNILLVQLNELFEILNQSEIPLIRIENKTYGICRVTGKLIAKERLKLVPHATLSMEAKNAQ